MQFLQMSRLILRHAHLAFGAIVDPPGIPPHARVSDPRRDWLRHNLSLRERNKTR
jgi:hypothetical protein